MVKAVKFVVLEINDNKQKQTTFEQLIYIYLGSKNNYNLPICLYNKREAFQKKYYYYLLLH